MNGQTPIQTRFLQIMREQAFELGLIAKGEISGSFINSADNKKKLPKSGSTYLPELKDVQIEKIEIRIVEKSSDGSIF